MMHTLLAERIVACDRLEAGQAAEGQGLRAAARCEACCFPYSTDPYLQGRFEQGLRDGRVILQCQAVEGQPSPSSAGWSPAHETRKCT